jgi:hypothetical protein
LNLTLPLVLSATLAVAPQSIESSAPAPARVTPAPPGTAATLGPDDVIWSKSAEEAQARAAREGKFLFFEFTKNECGNCGRMDGLLYPAAEFGALLASMVPIKIDLESLVGRQVAGRYGVKEAPSILVTTAEGRLVFLMEGFVNQANFFRHAHASLESYRVFSRKVDSQNIAKLPAKEALATGSELYQRSDPEAALSRLRRAVAASAAGTVTREDALELLAAVEFDLGQPASSRKTLDRLIATTKDPATRERGELFRAQIPLAENRPAEALALFRKFQKDHPASPHIARVNELVQRLEERTPRP